MRYVLFLFCLTLFALACKRKGEPFPRICTETVTTVAEEVTIKLTDTLALVNCSERYSKQRWVMPDGATSNKETVYFVPPYIGDFIVKLYVSDDDFVNEYEAIRKVKVVP